MFEDAAAVIYGGAVIEVSAEEEKEKHLNLHLQPVPRVEDTRRKLIEQSLLFAKNKDRPFTAGLNARLAVGLFSPFASLAQRLIRSSENKNPIAEGWRDYCLERRGPGPDNGFPITLAPRESETDETSPVIRAAKLICAATQLAVDIENDKVSKMHQRKGFDTKIYKNLFGKIREPRKHRDQLREKKDSSHIVVMYNGKIYKLPVLDNGDALSVVEIYKRLQAIIADNQNKEKSQSVSYLSVQDRKDWHDARNQLCRNQHNKGILKDIENALFAVCLDETNAEQDSLTDTLFQARYGNLDNRWPDMGLQVIIGKSRDTLYFDHAICDGSPAGEIAADIWQRSNELNGDFADSSERVNTERLNWIVDSELQTLIGEAQKRVENIASNRTVDVFDFEGFGSKLIKSCMRKDEEKGLQPDAIVQLAIQMALWDVYGEAVSVTEPVNMRHFSNGRLEPVSICTKESIGFAQSDSLDKEQLLDAEESHRAMIVQAKKGQGVLGHVLALARHISSTVSSSSLEGILGRLSHDVKNVIAAPVVASNGGARKEMLVFGSVDSRRADVCGDPNTFAIAYLIDKGKITFEIKGSHGYSKDVEKLKEKLIDNLGYLKKIIEDIPIVTPT